MPRTHGQTDDAIAGCALNVAPWEPLPGMVKPRCLDCRGWRLLRRASLCSAISHDASYPDYAQLVVWVLKNAEKI